MNSKQLKWAGRRISLSLLLAMYLLLPMSLPFTSAAETNVFSPWNASLPNVVLSDVEVDARSLEEAWRKLSHNYLLRSVLYVRAQDVEEHVPFVFKAQRCTGEALFDALVIAYPHMIWTQDQQTGVTWIHPRSAPLESILADDIGFETDEVGVRMVDGVLAALGRGDDLMIRPASTRGASPTSAFNYPVDVPAGVYSVRTLLSLCLRTVPGRTFQVTESGRDGRVYVRSVSIGWHDLKAAPPGAVHWWRTYIHPDATVAPSEGELIRKLSDKDRAVRTAARGYLEGEGRGRAEELLRRASETAEAVWVALAILDRFVRSEWVSGRSAIEALKKEINEDVILTGDQDMVLLAALELLRVADDVSALEIAKKRRFSPDALAGIESDLCRIVRTSERVRRVLANDVPDLIPIPEVRELMSRPNPERIRFRIVGDSE